MHTQPAKPRITTEIRDRRQTTPESIKVEFKASHMMNCQAFADGVIHKCGDAAAVEYFRAASLLVSEIYETADRC